MPRRKWYLLSDFQLISLRCLGVQLTSDKSSHFTFPFLERLSYCGASHLSQRSYRVAYRLLPTKSRFRSSIRLATGDAQSLDKPRCHSFCTKEVFDSP
jgi:hypothetical protein